MSNMPQGNAPDAGASDTAKEIAYIVIDDDTPAQPGSSANREVIIDDDPDSSEEPATGPARASQAVAALGSEDNTEIIGVIARARAKFLQLYTNPSYNAEALIIGLCYVIGSSTTLSDALKVDLESATAFNTQNHYYFEGFPENVLWSQLMPALSKCISTWGIEEASKDVSRVLSDLRWLGSCMVRNLDDSQDGDVITIAKEMGILVPYVPSPETYRTLPVLVLRLGSLLADECEQLRKKSPSVALDGLTALKCTFLHRLLTGGSIQIPINSLTDP